MRPNGFTFIEIMIVVAIVAILMLVAIPSYHHYIASARRSDGQIALLDLSTHLERFFNENNTYVGAAIPDLYPRTSPEGFYRLEIATTSATDYLIQAIPDGPQAKDDLMCGILTLDSLGRRGANGTNPQDCWSSKD